MSKMGGKLDSMENYYCADTNCFLNNPVWVRAGGSIANLMIRRWSNGREQAYIYSINLAANSNQSAGKASSRAL